MDKKTVKTLFQETDISLETGRLARQAGGSVVAQYGETVVIATAVGKKEAKEGQSFFPLTVDYVEKMYAAGRIPGNFFKREARPSTAQTLIARLIDRPLRPLFPKGFYNDVHVVINVLSYDGVHHPELLATVAASAALSISPIPFSGPVASVIVGYINGEFVVNPTLQELDESKLHLSIAGTKDAIMMVEGGADFVTEDQILKALELGHKAIKQLVALQEDLVEVAGKEKWEVDLRIPAQNLVSDIKNKYSEAMKQAIRVSGKLEKYTAIDKVKADILKYAQESMEDYETRIAEVQEIAEEILSHEFRESIVKDNLRPDNRDLEEIRQIFCEIGVLPRTHGSAVFTRGETQSLGTVTLGIGARDSMLIDGLEETYNKRFFLHYNFPAFSVNEVGGRPGPGRREIGHGALAERALSPIIPSEYAFPYTIRIVSDTLESNGSSSMASICSGTMALMNAGVPVKCPIAGIAMGLIKQDDDFVVLTDIAGIEDHLGDMDFKVSGSKDGITALQMDIKITGVTFEIIKQALAQAKKARLEILDTMSQAIPQTNEELSDYAPRLETIKIQEDKVGELIGPGGKTIKAIIEKTGVDIDIKDGGNVVIGAVSKDAIQAAKDEITLLFQEPEIGAKYEGTVKKVAKFGLFVEFMPGREALIHVSKVSDEYIKDLESMFNVGDKIGVKVEGIDDRGRVVLVRS